MATSYMDIQGVWHSKSDQLMAQVFTSEKGKEGEQAPKSLAHVSFYDEDGIKVVIPNEKAKYQFWRVFLPKNMKENAELHGSRFNFNGIPTIKEESSYNNTILRSNGDDIQGLIIPQKRSKSFLDLSFYFAMNKTFHFSKVDQLALDHGITFFDEYLAPKLSGQCYSIPNIWKIFLAERVAIAKFDKTQTDEERVIIKHDTVSAIGTPIADLPIFRTPFLIETYYRIISEIVMDCICNRYYEISSEGQNHVSLFDYTIFHEIGRVEDILNELSGGTPRHPWPSVRLPTREKSKAIFANMMIEFEGMPDIGDFKISDSVTYSFSQMLRISRTLLLCVGVLLCWEVVITESTQRDINWLLTDFFKRGKDESALGAIQIMASILWPHYPIFCFCCDEQLKPPVNSFYWGYDRTPFQ